MQRIPIRNAAGNRSNRVDEFQVGSFKSSRLLILVLLLGFSAGPLNAQNPPAWVVTIGRETPSRNKQEQRRFEGMVVDRHGYTITIPDAVDGTGQIQVLRSADASGNWKSARIIGVDPDANLAVIKFDDKNDTATAKLGNSDLVTAGDHLLAFPGPASGDKAGEFRVLTTGPDTIELGPIAENSPMLDPGTPVLDRSGEVVAISTGYIDAKHLVVSAIPSNRLIATYNQIIAHPRGECRRLDQLVQIDDAMPGGSGHCAGEADFWFTNTSAQAIDCAITFHKNGRFDPASVLTFTLSPGEKSGGTGKISTCGADSGQMQYQCFAHAENRAANSCTTQIQWQQ
jgi:trypsin-like peptidase